MIAQIIPNKRLVRNLDFFDYLIPDELLEKTNQGSLVEINFRNKKITGVVIEVLNKSNIKYSKLKPITKVLDTNFIPSNTLDIISYLEKEYFISKALALRTAMPAIIKSEITNQLSTPQIQPKKSSIDKSFCFYRNEQNKFNFVKELINNCKHQTLIIVPEVIDINRFISLLKLEKDIAIIHTKLSSREYFKNWQKARTAKLIIGTKQAIFAPFFDLKNIIIDQANNKFHKNYDQNPRYDINSLSYKLSEINSANLYLIDEYFTIEKYYEYKSGNLRFVSLENDLKKPTKIKTSLLDIGNEKKNNNFSTISYQFENAIEKTLKQNKKIFLFLNKKGINQLTRCFDCGHIYNCPECKIPLKKYSKLICPHCDYKTDIPLTCDKCQGANVKSFSPGIDTVKKEIEKLFPNKKIITIQKGKNNLATKADIYIGTSFAFKNVRFDNFGFFGIISIDQLLTNSSVNIIDTIYGLVTKCINLCLNNNIDQLILQTNFPENIILNSAIIQDYNTVYNQEILNKKRYNYPPFIKTIKLFSKYTPTTKQTVISEAKNIYNLIKKDLEISEMKDSDYNKHIYYILKVPNDFQFSLDLRKKIPQRWLVDIYPNDIL